MPGIDLPVDRLDLHVPEQVFSLRDITVIFAVPSPLYVTVPVLPLIDTVATLVLLDVALNVPPVVQFAVNVVVVVGYVIVPLVGVTVNPPPLVCLVTEQLNEPEFVL